MHTKPLSNQMSNQEMNSCCHEWAVFSTALQQGWLMLQCTICGSHGAVEDPSETEWAKAFYAPTHPYVWEDGSRVVVRSHGGSSYVARRESGELERVPREIIRHLPQVTQQEADDLLGIVRFVEQEEMTSELLCLFIQSASEWSGQSPSAGIAALCDRLHQFAEHGTVFSKQWVINAIRWYAKEGVHGNVA